jgi:hypothetical protein
MARRAPSFVLALAVVAGLAASTDLRADHAWGPYHWERVSDPVPLLLGDNVGLAWDDYLSEAIDDWDASPRLFLTLGEGAANPRNCRPGPGRIEVCSAPYGNTGWLGVAQIWVSDSHITQANTRLNDTYFSLPFYNTPAWRRFVMCQEIGHTFGLDHQDENFEDVNLGSCMDYTNNPAGPPSNEHPNAHDFDELDSIYSHFDTPSSPGGNGPGRGRGNGFSGFGMTRAEQTRALLGTIQALDPGEWGRLIRQHGRFAVFDLDLGNDTHLMTFVIWA